MYKNIHYRSQPKLSKSSNDLLLRLRPNIFCTILWPTAVKFEQLVGGLTEDFSSSGVFEVDKRFRLFVEDRRKLVPWPFWFCLLGLNLNPLSPVELDFGVGLLPVDVERYGRESSFKNTPSSLDEPPQLATASSSCCLIWAKIPTSNSSTWWPRATVISTNLQSKSLANERPSEKKVKVKLVLSFLNTVSASRAY
jgi:hypothetical protein